MNSVSDYYVPGLFKKFIAVSNSGGVSGLEDFASFIRCSYYFLLWIIFKVFVECVTILLLFLRFGFLGQGGM